MRLDPIGKTLPQLLQERARHDPGHLAQRHKDRGIWKPITWGAIAKNVEDFSNGLADLGLRKGDTLAIIGENEPELYQAEYAGLAQGAVIVCLYPDLTDREMEFILNNSCATMIVAQDQEQVDKVLSIRDRVAGLKYIIYWDPKGLWSYPDEHLLAFKDVQERGRGYELAHPGAYADAVARGKAEDMALCMYSSGTTGNPKGVTYSHTFLADNALRITASTEIPPNAEYLSYISPAWGTEQMFGITLGLLCPLTVNFPERPESVLHDLREISVVGIWFTPRQWESLASDIQARMIDAGPIRRRIFKWAMAIGLRHAETRIKGLAPDLYTRLMHPIADLVMLRPLRSNLGLADTRLAVCGGAAMAPDVFRLFHGIGVPLRNIYGSTEFGYICMHQGDRFDLDTVGQKVKIESHFGAELQWRIADDGELLVQGGSGFGGYLGLPEKSAEKMADDWYRTGDHCAITPEGELVFYDRMDDLCTLASGHRYPPQFIETRLRYSPYIKDVMTIGDQRHPFVGALINIDSETVTRWAEERSIPFSTFVDLSQRAEVRELVRREIEGVNRKLPSMSQVQRFACLPKELDPDDGELTRTRKLRRGFVADRYAALIDAIYSSSDKVDVHIPVRYQDGRVGELKALVHVNALEVPQTKKGVSASTEELEMSHG